METHKPKLSMITRVGLDQLARVYEMGANKYTRDGWRSGLPWTAVADAALRHIYAFLDGEDLDEESGLPHMAHAAWNCLTLVDFMLTHPEYDDRYKTRSEHHERLQHTP